MCMQLRFRPISVGEVFIADFQTVVEPSQSRDAAVRSGRKSASTPYAEFYRPLVEQLRREGIRPFVVERSVSIIPYWVLSGRLWYSN